MATINSVELYLGLSTVRSGWNVVVQIEDFGSYNANPEDPPTQGTKSLDVSNVPLISGAGPDWVVFTFDTPITISEDGFVGLLVTTTAPSAYQATPLRWFYAQDYTYASSAPWDGKERFYRWTSGGGWFNTGSAIVLAYKINCTDSTDNDATNPSGSYYNFGTYAKMGHRSYMDAAPALPGEPTTPTPGHTNTEVDFSDFTLSWVTGGNTDSYNVWFGDSENLYLISEEQVGVTAVVPYITEVDEAGTTHAYVDGNEINWDVALYWEVDAVNDVGITEGNVWNFDARPAQVSTFTPTNGATDLTLSSVGSTWESPSANTDSYNVYFGLESGSLFFVDETTGLLLDLVSVFPTYNYTYYWAIDAVNRFGVTSGNEVSFTTIAFYPPLPSGVTLDDDGNPTGTPTGESNMITVRKLVVAANSKIWIEDV